LLISLEKACRKWHELSNSGGLPGFLKGYPITHYADAAPHNPTLPSYMHAIVKKWLNLDHSLYEILRVLDLNMFETTQGLLN